MRAHELLASESFKDETVASLARSQSDELNLSFRGAQREHDALEDQFVVKDAEVKKAIRAYTRESTLNQLLIDGELSSHPKYERQYDLLMSLPRIPLHEEHHLYSGFGAFSPAEVMERKVFSTPAFISASLTLKPAIKTTNFRRLRQDADQDHVIHFLLPEGYTGGFYIAPYSASPEELEFILFPDQEFKVVATQKIEIGEAVRTIWSMRPLQNFVDTP